MDQQIDSPTNGNTSTPTKNCEISSVPISVTTASHPEPSFSSSSIQQQIGNIVATSIERNTSVGIPVTNHKNGDQAQKSIGVNIRSSGATLATSGGISLPINSLASKAKADNVTGERQITFPLAVVQPSSKHSHPYSAASRASINAQNNYATPPVASKNSQIPVTTANPSLVMHRQQSDPFGKSKETANSHKYQKVVGGKASIPRSVSLNELPTGSPQSYLEQLLHSRGYSTQNFCSLEGAYYCKPTPLQKASYGIKLVQAVRASDETLLRSLLECGLSPNPCNSFGESVVHMICRRGEYKLLKVLVDFGCSLQVTDDFGRTPLHDACWTAEPCFECVEMILDHDRRLLQIVDCRGSPPLSYVKADHWPKWVEFFKSKADKYWPSRCGEGDEPPPKLSQEAPHSRPILDPKNAIACEEAMLIAAGKKSTQEYLAKLSIENASEDQQQHSNSVQNTAIPPKIKGSPLVCQ
jgi:ankyrin repeat protein|mmetsp:Transcript_9907/g.15251  ORF Transcript_9907/g.15251 Transcript_9907/m.15251 type:complete len:469 (-) Transcript_9907:81-1487(-)|eukprot:CAMPEP_0195303450 /NCGR_PEP_ID=MMETSP0707-20130614/32805_1 /TAXON_ID=33640 /ORGANISM="Asterionellopsis glacialis, Strain CCMP134" /LENGTH=468 /DNA_ID=CAMNT_0040367005 /DNA_START=147 /DNA_END=1553 /DNA_ORIENTATION=+